MQALIVNKKTKEETMYYHIRGYDSFGAVTGDDGAPVPVFLLLLDNGSREVFTKDSYELYVREWEEVR